MPLQKALTRLRKNMFELYVKGRSKPVILFIYLIE